MEEYARILRGESEVYYSITKLAVYWYKASDMTRDMYRLLAKKNDPRLAQKLERNDILQSHLSMERNTGISIAEVKEWILTH